MSACSLIDHPTEGKIWNIEAPNKLSGGARTDFLPAPKIGQQSVEILRETGYSEKEIEALVASGATIDGRLQR